MTSAIEDYMESGDLSRTEKMRVLSRVSGQGHDKPELAENALLRLVGLLTRDRMTTDEFNATLDCPHFARSLTRHELKQIKTARDALWDTFGLNNVDDVADLNPIQKANVQGNPEIIHLEYVNIRSNEDHSELASDRGLRSRGDRVACLQSNPAEYYLFARAAE